MRWFLFLFPLSLFAAYIGNPASPAIMDTGIFSLRNPLIKGTSGYIADYTSDKHYVTDQIEPGFDPNETFKTFGLHSQLGTFSLILLERLEIFGNAGGTKEHAKWHSMPPASAFEIDFKSDYHFSWSAGCKVVLLQWGQTFLSGDFTYFAVPSSPQSFFQFFNRLNIPITAKKQTFSLNEWQTSLALSSRFFFITPYLGGTYLNSHLNIESGPNTGSIEYHNQDKWGLFFGFTISITGRFHLNFERRLYDESAYAFSTIAVF